VLTDEGRSRLQDAADAVLAVEDHMLAALTLSEGRGSFGT
jgi:hypothetical protein